MEEGLLSIIIPGYNAEKYVERNIRSVLNQTYKNFELIFIDDGSKDKTYQIVEKLANEDKRVKLSRHENKGVCATRNDGLKIASGEYITFLDDDDYIEPNMYEVLINLLKTTNTDVASGKLIKEFQYLKEDFYYNYTNEDIKNAKIKVFDNPNDIIKNIIEGDYHLEGFIWNKVYKASAIKGVFFNENISLMEDIMFSFDVGLLKNIKYSFIDLTFYHYRIFNASTTRNINVNKFNNSFLIMQDVINLTKKYSITSVPSLVYQYLNIIFLYFEKVFQNKKNLSKIEFKNHLKNIKENINICLNYQVKLNFYQKVRIISFKISKIFTYLIFVKLKNFVRNHLRTR